MTSFEFAWTQTLSNAYDKELGIFLIEAHVGPTRLKQFFALLT